MGGGSLEGGHPISSATTSFYKIYNPVQRQAGRACAPPGSLLSGSRSLPGS